MNNIMHIIFACVCEVINMGVVTYVLSRRKCSADRTRERERERESVREKERERRREIERACTRSS